jgi:hypothetical protein
MRGRASAAILWTALAVSPALAWRVDLRGGRLHSQDVARAAGVLPGGDAILLGDLDCDATVLRIDRITGAVVWRTEVLTYPYPCLLPMPGLDSSPPPLAVEGDDAVVFALGGLVVKLDAATGAERWRRQIDAGPFDTFLNALVVDRAGGVAVAGVILPEPGESEYDFLVASLDGATGAERWRLVRNGTPGPPDPENADWNDTSDEATALALDGAGNLIVAGVIERHGQPRWYVVQLAADTGAVRWQQRIRRQQARLLSLDVVSGEVVVAGLRAGGGIAVQALRTANGARRWRRVLFPRTGGLPRSLLAVPGGDVFLAVWRGDGGGAAVHLAAAGGAVRWIQALQGAGRGLDEVRDIVLDATGNPVFSSRLHVDDQTTVPAVVALLAADGTQRWRWTPGDRPGDASINALGIAGTDVIAVGQTGDPSVDTDVLAARLASSDGAVGWERHIDGGAADGDDAAVAVATTAGGDVIAAGGLENGDTGSDFAVVRLGGGSGTVQWRYEVNGTRQFFDSAYDVARRVVIDSHGDVVAAGSIEQAATDWDLAVVKLAGDTGTERWRVLVSGTADGSRDVASTLATDPTGDVVVAGTVENAYGPVRGTDFFVAKLAGDTGAERWRRIVTFPYGQPFGIAVTADGDVVVARVASEFATSSDFVVLKLAGDSGADRWRTNLNGTDGAFEAAHALVLAPGGDVVAGGYLRNVETGDDWTVVRLAGDTGVERWRHVVDGPAHGADVAEAVALDASGDVLVAGTLQAASETWQVLVARLDGSTGVERWRRIAETAAAPIPPPVALAAASNGDALLTSAQTASVQEQNLLVARVAGSDGSEAWRRVLSGSAPGVGRGAAIAERADGAVVVAGRTVNAGSGPDFTVLTLAGLDGSDVPGAP